MPDLTNDGILMKGTVAEWRDVSFYADMMGDPLLADRLWELVEKMPKERLKRILFRNVGVVSIIRRIRDANNLGIIEMWP